MNPGDEDVPERDLTPDQVLEDFLAEQGFSVTAHQLRCLQSAVNGARDHIENSVRGWSVTERFNFDLRYSIDQMHSHAQWEDAEFVASRSAKRPR